MAEQSIAKMLTVEVLTSDQYGKVESLMIGTFIDPKKLSEAVDTINAMRFKVPFTIKIVEAEFDKPNYRAICKYVDATTINSCRIPIVEPIIGDALTELNGVKRGGGC